ncbi:metal ABC transporter substrate-binding protein [Herbaspirillum seropedicae]|uniref:ABC-type Mn2+/Zn2+ transport system, periplasmic component protein n=1 Tax=Herbaspirillum seropedicae (strain SmR1) TaxID=757424 RepID=D8J177_HERSS|nr:metal ABC transporter substrate-binding protein [Herbaspirillum seropedicae]ADJ64646.1 ABC-type Mn2+/Zn2+ transport system, periplasmic component protein [Herbaspirillum seropedicae SmR1]AKN66564.1 metal ABC transporter substrate-binding protein [Herbaspirillum seropedicae]NQE28444.1 metal ABC transporter substrate-binding protein [Herbaspirillum seropedicae]UMU22555.1 metal ABC transporter substrate-binding protein [Herbaspirillum seropedicae]
MKLYRPLSMLLAALALAVNVPAAAAERIPVLASFSILGDVVANVGGDRIAVSTLVGPDEDAHVFQPAPDDIKAVSRARLVVVNGLGFEGWMERLAQSANYRGPIVVASAGIKARERVGEDEDEHGHDHAAAHEHHGKDDPHAWQDPQNVVVYTRNIVTALAKLDPAGAAVYRKNGDAYIAKLQDLDAWAARQFAQIPDAKRKVITSHDAFEYFGARYQVRFLAAQGVSTDSEPSAREIAALIRQIRTEKIKALFFENMSNPKLLQQIAREAGTAPGGKLYADALSKADGPAPDYLSLMRYNITQLLEKIRLN